MNELKTVLDLLNNAGVEEKEGYTFLTDSLEERTWSFADLHKETKRRGQYFRSLGLEPGDRMAMVIPDGEDFVLSFLGAIQAGIVPVPMYPPLALGKLDSYIETAKRIVATSGAKILLTSKKVSSILWSLVGSVPSLTSLELVEAVQGASAEGLPELEYVAEPSDICFLQFTSGSTSDPKGVQVTHQNLVANAKAIIIDGLGASLERGDRGVSWLPLFHDMGLIGFVIAPLFTKVPVVFIPTLTFAKRPLCWMSTISKYRGTITFAPNFAFGLASKRMTPKKLANLDLSSLRVLGCGAEPINAETARAFAETYAPAGFDPNALMPSYGMAEATLAIAFDRLDQPMTSVRIDREAYEADKKAVVADESASELLELVACGTTFPEHKLGVMDETGQLVSEGTVGEIVFSGPSVTTGYFNNALATRSALVDGWLHTGDLGFMLEGRVYISGRIKDLIILNGRNYYPQSIEWEVEQLAGVRRGNVAAFSTLGENSEALVVVAETKLQDKQALIQLENTIKETIQTALGLRTDTVKLIAAGALPKTSSGKLQRAKTKRMFEAGTLGTEVRTTGSPAAKLMLARHLAYSAFARITYEIKRPARVLRSPTPLNFRQRSRKVWPLLKTWGMGWRADGK